MPADYRIRRALVSEAAQLTDLAMRSKAMWGYDETFMAMCAEELTVRTTAIAAANVWVAEADGAVVGFLELVMEGPVAEVRMIFVEPVWVRSGVGRALWEHAEDHAQYFGADTLALDADPNAVPFYERMGMRHSGERPSGSIPGRTLPRMVKSLNAGSHGRAA